MLLAHSLSCFLWIRCFKVVYISCAMFVLSMTVKTLIRHLPVFILQYQMSGVRKLVCYKQLIEILWVLNYAHENTRPGYVTLFLMVLKGVEIRGNSGRSTMFELTFFRNFVSRRSVWVWWSVQCSPYLCLHYDCTRCLTSNPMPPVPPPPLTTPFLRFF